jgi:hypothetical protein
MNYGLLVRAITLWPPTCLSQSVAQGETKARKAMLRITVEEGPLKVTIKLEGKVVGSWVAEFDRAWRSLEPSWGSKKFSLDLRGVSFVDAEGGQLMQEIYKKTGAAFVTDSPLTMYFAEKAMQASPKNGHKGA